MGSFPAHQVWLPEGMFSDYWGVFSFIFTGKISPKIPIKITPKYGPGNLTLIEFFPDFNTVGPIFRSFNPPIFFKRKEATALGGDASDAPGKAPAASPVLRLGGYQELVLRLDWWMETSGVKIEGIHHFSHKNQIQIWPTARPTAMVSTSQTRQKNVPTDWLSRPASGAAHGWPAGRGSGWRFGFSPNKNRSW